MCKIKDFKNKVPFFAKINYNFKDHIYPFQQFPLMLEYVIENLRVSLES